MDQSRREFLTNTAWKGAAAMAAVGAAKCGMGMLPSEQAAYDKYNAMTIPRPDGLLDGEPMLQVPAPDSMGVAFAVTALANGFVEIADNPQMNGAVRFMADRVTRMKLTGRRSDSKIAAMMVQGNTRGMLKGLKNLHQLERRDERLQILTQKLLDCEDANIRQMHQFL